MNATCPKCNTKFEMTVQVYPNGEVHIAGPFLRCPDLPYHQTGLFIDCPNCNCRYFQQRGWQAERDGIWMADKPLLVHYDEEITSNVPDALNDEKLLESAIAAQKEWNRLELKAATAERKQPAIKNIWLE